MKSSREQFEEWARSSGCDVERYKTGINKGDFKNPVMRKMWLAWHASREAIVVSLPDKEDPANFFCEIYDCYKVQSALSAHGIKIEGEI